MNPSRQAYFLDRRILYFFEDIQYLPTFTDKGLYYALKQEQKYGKLQGIRLCTEKTFYRWLADGRKEMKAKDCTAFNTEIKLTKTGQLARHIERLRQSMRFELMNGLYQSALKSNKISEISFALEILGYTKKYSKTRN